jgi:hypothetical protein
MVGERSKKRVEDEKNECKKYDCGAKFEYGFNVGQIL